MLLLPVPAVPDVSERRRHPWKEQAYRVKSKGDSSRMESSVLRDSPTIRESATGVTSDRYLFVTKAGGYCSALIAAAEASDARKTAVREA